LTGANLGCYSAGGHGLIALVRAVEKIADVDRVRLSSIELSTAEHAIVEHMAGSAKLCPYLHVPLQTGDGRLLSAMGRRYTAAQYRQFVARASKLIPLLGLGTDIMVGLPGEDDSAFAHTLQLVQDLPFSNLHVFPYSKRPGTRAAAMPGPVPAAVKRERSARLIALGEAKRREFAERFVGRPVSVLVERVSAGNIGIGWTRERIEARIATPRVKANDIVEFVPSAVDDDARLV
jgi:threonylcarbamoyladenosine tRNA methylthiotransferase MtaB